LTAFDIESDGTLKNRRVWAGLEDIYPDGICLDAEGAILVAAPRPGEVLRVKEGGMRNEGILSISMKRCHSPQFTTPNSMS